jgi:hypothetical protein
MTYVGKVGELVLPRTSCSELFTCILKFWTLIINIFQTYSRLIWNEKPNTTTKHFAVSYIRYKSHVSNHSQPAGSVQWPWFIPCFMKFIRTLYARLTHSECVQAARRILYSREHNHCAVCVRMRVFNYGKHLAVYYCRCISVRQVNWITVICLCKSSEWL